MKIVLYAIVIALSTLSCVEENNTNNDTKISTELSIDTSSKTRIDSTIIESNSIKKEQTFINPEFLNLVKTMDSLGYLYDTIKLKKSYRHFHFIEIITKKGYLFYKHELENTAPFITRKRILSQINSKANKEMNSLELEKFKRWKSSRLLNLNFLKKVKSIYSYHYISKKPSPSGSSKTFKDGIIEQWQFESEEEAKMVGDDIREKAWLVYVNRGAYVCYLKNYVYIFHSRSSGFYTPLKNFFTFFVKTNKATKAKRGRLRNSY